MRKVGEDVTGILGYIPGHFEVIKCVRPANYLFAGPDAGGERAAAAYAHRERQGQRVNKLPLPTPPTAHRQLGRRSSCRLTSRQLLAGF
jgi:hypothetical protein